MRIIFLILMLFFFTTLHAQNFAGKWRWQVEASPQDLQDNYLLELDLKQEGKKIFGTRTLYLKNYENIVVWVEGQVSNDGELYITSTRVINFKLPDSIMVAKSFSYSFRKDRFSEGMMVGVFRPREDPSKLKMRMVDPRFYEAIYLRPAQSVFKKLADTLTASIDSLIAINRPPAAAPAKITPPPVKPVVKTPEIITEIAHTLTIPAGDVSIDLYDNGTVDGDIVTLLVNDKIVSEHQKLGIAPISIKIKKEDLGDSTMVIMQAENLGDFPPNTALMLITVNGKRYDLNISSTLQKRAAVVLKKAGSK